MSEHFARELIEHKALVHTDSPSRQVEVDRTFGLPSAFYGATAALYFGFIGVMALGLHAPGLIIPMAIFALFFTAAFGVPTLWVKMGPANTSRALSWGELKRKGIFTMSGRVGAIDAAIQVLLLPALIFAWGIIVVTIIALT